MAQSCAKTVCSSPLKLRPLLAAARNALRALASRRFWRHLGRLDAGTKNGPFSASGSARVGAAGHWRERFRGHFSCIFWYLMLMASRRPKKAQVAKCVACAVFLQLFRRWARVFAQPATRFNFFQARRQASQTAKNGKNRGLRSVFVGFSASCARLRTAGHWRELRREPATAQKTAKTVACAVFSCSFQPFAHGCARQATGESSRDLPRRPKTAHKSQNAWPAPLSPDKHVWLSRSLTSAGPQARRTSGRSPNLRPPKKLLPPGCWATAHEVLYSYMPTQGC